MVALDLALGVELEVQGGQLAVVGLATMLALELDGVEVAGLGLLVGDRLGGGVGLGRCGAVVGGGGTMGRHEIAPIMVHYAGAYSGYGPIIAGPEGVKYFTIRAVHEAGEVARRHEHAPRERGERLPVGPHDAESQLFFHMEPKRADRHGRDEELGNSAL